MVRTILPIVTLVEVDGRTFRDWLATARYESPLIAAATSDPDDDPATPGTRYVLTADSESGYAIRPDGELVYVFSAVKGRGDMLIRDAVERGATRLDCFDGYLPSLYARHGFVETSREPNWTPGEPDVVFMALA